MISVEQSGKTLLFLILSLILLSPLLQLFFSIIYFINGYLLLQYCTVIEVFKQHFSFL